MLRRLVLMTRSSSTTIRIGRLRRWRSFVWQKNEMEVEGYWIKVGDMCGTSFYHEA